MQACNTLTGQAGYAPQVSVQQISCSVASLILGMCSCQGIISSGEVPGPTRLRWCQMTLSTYTFDTACRYFWTLNHATFTALQGAHCTDMRVPDQQVPVEQPDSQQQQEGFCSQQRHQQWQQQSLRLQQYGASQQGSSQCQHRPDNPRQECFEAQSSFSKQQAATLAMLQQLSLQEQKQLMEMQELRQMATTPETAALLAQAERLLQNTRCTIQLQEKLLKQLVELQGMQQLLLVLA